MGVIDLLGRLLNGIGRLLGLGRAGMEPALPSGQAVAASAVAVLAWHHRQDPFLLARRITSVARLNVPFGRKPVGSKSRFQGLPPVPKDRLGAKRTRLDANRGPRVLVRPASPAAGARIIPFPVAAARGPATAADRRKRAA